MYESSLGISSRPDAFEKPRLVTTFLTNLDGVTEILCSFRLVLEEKIAQEIPESTILGFPEKFLTILLYQKQKTTSPGR